MGVKEDELVFSTKRTVKEIGQMLQITLEDLRAGSIEPITSNAGPLAVFDDHADIEIVAQGAEFTGLWAVQVFVSDKGDSREVFLIALGEGGWSRAWVGPRHTYSLSISINKRNAIADALR